jgi:hypothetical protein
MVLHCRCIAGWQQAPKARRVSRFKTRAEVRLGREARLSRDRVKSVGEITAEDLSQFFLCHVFPARQVIRSANSATRPRKGQQPRLATPRGPQSFAGRNLFFNKRQPNAHQSPTFRSVWTVCQSTTRLPAYSAVSRFLQYQQHPLLQQAYHIRVRIHSLGNRKHGCAGA